MKSCSHSRRRADHLILSACVVALLASVSSGVAHAEPEDEEALPISRQVDLAREGMVDTAGDGLVEAALTPLSDINLMREEIPPLLKALRSPYEPVGPFTCAEIAVEVDALTAVLGDDIDVATAKVRAALGTQAGEAAGKATLDAVRSEVGGLIPFRGIVRQVSGAKDHERKVVRAYDTGRLRRAYLKGIGQAQGCAIPAAPIPMPEVAEAESKIQYRADRPRARRVTEPKPR